MDLASQYFSYNLLVPNDETVNCKRETNGKSPKYADRNKMVEEKGFLICNVIRTKSLA